jgi:hypothetical protein
MSIRIFRSLFTPLDPQTAGSLLGAYNSVIESKSKKDNCFFHHSFWVALMTRERIE